MKKIYFAIVLVAFAFLTSCEKETMGTAHAKLERNMTLLSDTTTTDTGGEDRPRPIH